MGGRPPALPAKYSLWERCSAHGVHYLLYALMLALLERGVAIVMVSSELPEVLGMSHRVLVVRDGHVRGEFARADATPAKVIALAAGAAA